MGFLEKYLLGSKTNVDKRNCFPQSRANNHIFDSITFIFPLEHVRQKTIIHSNSNSIKREGYNKSLDPKFGIQLEDSTKVSGRLVRSRPLGDIVVGFDK